MLSERVLLAFRYEIITVPLFAIRVLMLEGISKSDGKPWTGIAQNSAWGPLSTDVADVSPVIWHC